MPAMKLNSLYMTVVAIATIACCHSLRIRRSGVAGYDDPYGLTKALGAMERSSRANYDRIVNRGFPDEEESYFNPNTEAGYELSPMDYLSAMGYENNAADSLSGYAYDRSMPTYRQFETVPMMYAENEANVYGPQKRTAYNPRRVVPTIDELRTLFGEADVPMKRLAPVKRRQPQLGSAIANQDYTAKRNIKRDKTQLSKQWGELINAAEQLTKNNIQGDDDEPENGNVIDNSDDSENTIQDELQEAFSDAQVDDNDDGMADNEGDEETSNQPQSKSKRASSGLGDTSDYILSLLKDIAELKQKVSVLEMKQLLEDRENDFLANALKFSTIDQINGDDDYVKEEYADIAKATKIEELMQQFSDAVEDTDDYSSDEGDLPTNYGAEFDPEEISTGDMIKRSEGEETQGEWLETPVEESVKGGAFLKDEDNIDAFTGDESTVNPYDDDSMDDFSENESIDDSVDDVLSEKRSDATGNKELLLSRLINNLSPDTVQEILTDLQNQQPDIDETSSEICPAVMELSQNCAFADERDIPLDDEARELCIRHQLCYTCGEALDISASRCDGGYKGTVIAECDGDVTCVRSSAYFLRLMTSQYHTYQPYSPEQCLSSCVKDFIYGVA